MAISEKMSNFTDINHNATMDKKQSDILIFLDYWDNDNPTSDAQMGFMFAQMDNEEESEDIGEVYSNDFFYQKNPKEAIKEEIAKHRPKWVIGIENTATLLLPYHRQKKILINPTVTVDDLNWVTAETIRDTYAFFSANYEKDYEVYSKVYKNVAFYPMQKILFISDIKAAIEAILSEG